MTTEQNIRTVTSYDVDFYAHQFGCAIKRTKSFETLEAAIAFAKSHDSRAPWLSSEVREVPRGNKTIQLVGSIRETKTQIGSETIN